MMSNEISDNTQKEIGLKDSIEIMVTGSLLRSEIGYSVKYKDVCLYITILPLELTIQKAYKNGLYDRVNVGWRLDVKSKQSYPFEKGGALPLYVRYDKSSVFRRGSIPVNPDILVDRSVEYANGLDGDMDMLLIAKVAYDILGYAEHMDSEKLWNDEPYYEHDLSFDLHLKENAVAKTLIHETRQKIWNEFLENNTYEEIVEEDSYSESNVNKEPYTSDVSTQHNKCSNTVNKVLKRISDTFISILRD